MKLKLDENGNVVVQDGKPVYVHDDGKEVAFDAPATVATISRLNGEAKSHREGKEAAEKALKAFEGIADPSAAIKALETVANLDAKKLVDAGEIEKVKAEIGKAYQEKLDTAEKRAADAETRFYDSEIGGAFSRSPMITGKEATLLLPPEVARATFGKSFKLEDGKIVGYDNNGQKIYSRERPGELATFDEALSHLVDTSPFKDSILKSSGANGGGAPSNGGQGGGGGKKTITRTAFNDLSPADQSKHVQGGGTVTD